MPRWHKFGPDVDMRGERFSRLTIVSLWGHKGGKWHWRCRCDCGTEVVVAMANLKSNNIRSCRCLQRELARERVLTHGETGTPLFRVWDSMRRRCLDKRHEAFRWYGGRGIKVCAEWLESFSSFRDWAMANGYRAGLSIDRIDNNAGYSPNNCRWATIEVQANNKRSNRRLTAFGESKTLKQWSHDARCLVEYSTLQFRAASGWPAEMALTAPLKTQFRQFNRNADRRCKLTDKQVRELLSASGTQGELAERFGITQSGVSVILRRHRKLQHGGEACPN